MTLTEAFNLRSVENGKTLLHDKTDDTYNRVFGIRNNKITYIDPLLSVTQLVTLTLDIVTADYELITEDEFFRKKRG
jgi:hypothetical protein